MNNKNCHLCKNYKDGYCEELELKPCYPEKGCDYFTRRYRLKNDMIVKLVIEIPETILSLIRNDIDYDISVYDSDLYKAIANGIPFQETCDREKSEIKNEVKDLSKRVETLEKQLKEEKEEQLEKLKAEIDYAKFRCALIESEENKYGLSTKTNKSISK